MPVSILDYLQGILGESVAFPAGTPVSCEVCLLELDPACAYLSRSGQCRCGGCIADTGYTTLAEARKSTIGLVGCPSCGNTDTISEIRITTAERTEEYALECGDCSEVWQP